MLASSSLLLASKRLSSPIVGPSKPRAPLVASSSLFGSRRTLSPSSSSLSAAYNYSLHSRRTIAALHVVGSAKSRFVRNYSSSDNSSSNNKSSGNKKNEEEDTPSENTSLMDKETLQALKLLETRRKEIERKLAEERKQGSPRDRFRPSQTFQGTYSGNNRESIASSRDESPKSETNSTRTSQGSDSTSGASSDSSSNKIPPPKAPKNTSLAKNSANEAEARDKSAASESGSTSETVEGSSTLGHITPKKITIEEAEALGIDTSKLKGDEKKPSIFENPVAKKKREQEEAYQRASIRDGRPNISIPYSDIAKHVKKHMWWYIVGGLIAAPLVLEAAFSRDIKDARKEDARRYEERWERADYTSLANDYTQGIIFEMCGMAAIGALPPFNPISSPLLAVRGHLSPIYPKERRGLKPPTFWKLRIDFPGPKETVWEKNEVTEVVVQPASPDYNGSQFMWILARTWENGEPVIRVLTGKQVGGTVSANPKRSLIPWRSPAFRPRRLHSWKQRPLEVDTMFNHLYAEDTFWYKTLQRAGGGRLEKALSELIDFELEEYEYDMLDSQGFGDYLYDPNSVEWPADLVVIDPLGVMEDYDEDDDFEIPKPGLNGDENVENVDYIDGQDQENYNQAQLEQYDESLDQYDEKFDQNVKYVDDEDLGEGEYEDGDYEDEGDYKDEKDELPEVQAQQTKAARRF